MSHCPHVKPARPEQPHRYGASLSARATINFALRWHWTWWTALPTLAMFGDSPFPGRAVRPHAITFSDSCRIDRTVLASFHSVAGKLSSP
jgi:hypothetical protein